MREYVQGKSWPGRSRSITAYRNILRGTAAFLTLAGAWPEFANAASFNVGGGTITTTDADNFIDNTGTGGPFQLQANSTTTGDLVTISGVTIDNSSTNAKAIEIGGGFGGAPLASAGSYTVRMNGSTLLGDPGISALVFQAWTSSGAVTLDTTGGGPNTISGYVGYGVTGGAAAVVTTGADVINTFFTPLLVGANSSVTIDSVGATLTSATAGLGVDAISNEGSITIGGTNGGFASTINTPNGTGIRAITSNNQANSGASVNVTLAPTGIINASNNGIEVRNGASGMVSVDNYGTINTPGGNAIFAQFTANVTLTLHGGSTTVGNVEGSFGNTTYNIFTGANIDDATFHGNGLGHRIALKGTGSSTFDVSTATDIAQVQKDDSGTWTLTRSAGAGVSTATFVVNTGRLIGTADSIAGDVTIGSGATLQFDQGTSASYGSIISGNGTLQKTNSGILTLTSANTYTGATNVSAGILQAGIANAFGSNSAVTVATGATLDFNGFSQAIGSLAGGGNVTLGAASLTAGGNSSAVFSGVISGTGSLIKSGTGTLTLTGNNTYSGGTTLDAGTISLGSNSALGTGSLITNGSVVDYANGVTISNPIVVNSNSTQLQVLTGTATQNEAISETGGARPIEKIGAGTLILTTTNAYSGGTVISGGTLSISSDENLGAVSGGITFNGGTIQVRGANISITRGIVLNSGGGTVSVNSITTLSGTISGSGGLTKAGGATLTLTASNTYGGGTVISGGTLEISADDNLGGASGGITFNGGTMRTLASISSARNIVLNSGGATFNTNGFVSTLSGTISGSGGLMKMSPGVLTLTANNTYTGITEISGGPLQLGNGGTTGSIAGNVTNNSALNINRSNTLTLGGTISGIGSLAQIGSGTTILTANNTYTGGTTIAAGTLQLGNGGTTGAVAGNVVNNGTFAFNRSDAHLFAGVISGTGGVVQNGTGVAILSATNTYTGATVVNAGTLVVNGSIAASSGVTVNAGGALSGSGTIGNMTINGGTLAPGNSIGTVVVNGNLTFTGNSTYAVEVSSSAADLTTVTGVATVAGTLQATALGGTYTPGTQYTVINAAGGVAGTFGALTLAGDFTTAVRPRLAYDATRVYLVLDPNTISQFLSGATANETTTAMALDQVFLGGNAPSPFLSLFGLSGGALNAAMASLSGEIHASTRTAALDDSRFVREAVMKRLSAGIASDNMTQDGNEIWGVAFGSWGHTASDGNAARFDRNIGGFLAGIDRTVGGAWRFGLAGGYSYSGGTATGLIGSKNDSTGHVAAYAGGAMGPWRLRLGAANAWNNFSTNRVAAFTGFSDTLRADYTGRTTQVFGEAGFHMDFDRLPVEPFVGFTYVNLHTDSFRETGGAAALNGIAASNDVTFSSLGVRSGNMFGMMEGTVSVHGVLAWQHAYETSATRSSLAIASANASFFAAGAPIAQDSALIQVGAGMNLSPGVNVSLDYTGRFASGFSDNGVKAYASWRF